MEKSTFEQMGGTYYKQGDYFLPNFSVPESAPVGIWGVRHLCYLKKHRQAIYTAMLLSDMLNFLQANNIMDSRRMILALWL